MISGVIAKLKNELVTLHQRIWSDDQGFDIVMMSLELGTHYSVRLFKKVIARWEEPPRTDMDYKEAFRLIITNLLPLTLFLRWSSATYHSAKSGKYLFPNYFLPSIPPPSMGMKGVPPTPRTVSDSPVLFQDSSATSRSLGSNFRGVQVQENIRTLYSRVVDFWFYRLLINRRVHSLQKAHCIHNHKNRVLGLCPTLGDFTEEKR